MNYRQIAVVVLASFIVVPLLALPIRTEILAAIPFNPPIWGVPGMVITSVMLFAAWAWLWKNRPAGVFGR